MSTLTIETKENRTEFFPGEEISGRIAWELETPAKSVELRLFWYTRGKGDTDVRVVDRLHIDGPRPWDQREFRFPLPDAPYSFSGKIVSLIWALELVAQPSGESTRREFLVTPTGSEVVLHKSTESAK